MRGCILAIHTATPGTHTIALVNGSKVSFDLPE
jgi:hypothetical protein